MIGEDQQQVGSGPSHIAALVTRINAAHRTDFTLSGRFAQGEQGAFLLLDGRALRYVLKWQPGPASAAGADRLTALEAMLERLRAAGYPAPRLVLHGVSAEHPTGRYSVQEALSGAPATHIDDTLVDQILALNALQAGLAHGATVGPPAAPWPALPVDDVLRGGDGYCLLEPMRAHSATTAALLAALQDYVAAHESEAVPRDDVVHFDLNPANILVASGRVTGVVDWDGARSGDRAFDLCTLLYYAHDPRRGAIATVRAKLWDRATSLVGAAAAGVYLAHMAHRQVEWMVRHHPEAVGHWLATTAAVLADVAARSGWPKDRLLGWNR